MDDLVQQQQQTQGQQAQGWGAPRPPLLNVANNGTQGWGQPAGSGGQSWGQQSSSQSSSGWGSQQQQSPNRSSQGGVVVATTATSGGGQQQQQGSGSQSTPPPPPPSTNPAAPASSWAQAAGKSLQPNSTTAASLASAPAALVNLAAVPPPLTASSSVTSKQIEQLNSMREALFSHDGWGGQNVNQDSGWDIPGSPEPHHKDIAGISSNSAAAATAASGPGWKASNVNNGTDLWEANLRSGGAPPPQPTPQKAPWHTPSTNHGGTWGEEDDSTETSNVWRDQPPPTQPTPQWQPPPRPTEMWPKKDEWQQQAPPQPVRQPQAPPPPMAPQQQAPPLPHQSEMPPQWAEQQARRPEPMWNKAPPPQQQQQAPPPQWQMKDKGGSGWDDVSPPAQRRGFDDGTSLWGQQQQRRMKVEAGGGWQQQPQQQQQSRNGGWNGAGSEDLTFNSITNPGSWDEKPAGWNEQHWTQQKPKTPTNGPGWGEDGLVDTTGWGGAGKKDDPSTSDLSLRASALHLSEAIDTLDNLTQQRQASAAGLPQDWPQRNDHFDLSLSIPPMQQQQMQQQAPQQQAVPPQRFPPFGGGGPSLASINPSLIQKILQQQQQGGGGGFPQQQGQQQQQGQPRPQQPPPPQQQQQQQTTPAQLRMLVQQIQMAVQAGYLSSQILQHPLPQQSLYLLNNLLQQIKIFQQLTQAQHQIGKSNPTAAVQLHVQITKTKQHITNLHNQIATQQALHAKQQQQNLAVAAAAAAVASTSSSHSDFFNKGTMDPMLVSALQGRDFNPDFLKDSGQTSRLTQWTKMPEKVEPGEEWARKFQQQREEGTWSSQPRPSAGADGWPTAADEKALNVDAWPSDLVPEFEPGKPWKGNNHKSVEDDPTLTPGSVVRSPLSLAIKDASEIFSKNTAPTTAADSAPLSLSSNTWSFTPTGGQQQQNAPPKSKSSWDPPTTSWDFPSRPPPGLTSTKKNNGFRSYPPSNFQQPHYWLLLRNLTPQIDGSTLRTLCLQHGPLQNFQLFLNHGIALVKYSGREEAPKAQNALNSCVLGNTTILAETASEADVHNLIAGLSGGQQQQQQQQQQQSAGATPPTPKTALSDSSPWGLRDTSPLWGSSPWGNSDPSAPDRATPSSLNSLLPGDLDI